MVEKFESHAFMGEAQDIWLRNSDKLTFTNNNIFCAKGS